jgi:tetratricopeptide (TPR) repeat protein
MGTMYAETGRLDKAEPLEQRALEIRQSLNDSTAIGTTYMHLAVLYLAKHDPATAETDAEMAVSLIAPTQPHPLTSASPTPEQQMAALINLSLVRCARRSCATAIPQLTRALALAQANYQPSSVPVGFIHFLLGYANWKSGNPTAAAQLMKAGTSELESQLGWGHPTYIAALKQYQGFLTQSGDTAEALEVGARLAAFNRSHQGQPSSPARASLSLDQLP